MKPTNHTDFVVAPLDQMMMLWSAVNIIYRDGAKVGIGQAYTSILTLLALIESGIGMG